MTLWPYIHGLNIHIGWNLNVFVSKPECKNTSATAQRQTGTKRQQTEREKDVQC